MGRLLGRMRTMATFSGIKPDNFKLNVGWDTMSML
jgi:hypothetical protein